VEGHSHVREEVAARVRTVCADAANFRGEVDDKVGLGVREGGAVEAGDLGLVGEVGVLATRDEDVLLLEAGLEEFLLAEAPEEAPPVRGLSWWRVGGVMVGSAFGAPFRGVGAMVGGWSARGAFLDAQGVGAVAGTSLDRLVLRAR
jgi:hypothetical protein